MRKSSFKDFLTECNSKKDAISKNDIQRAYNYPIYPRDSNIELAKGFVNNDNEFQSGTHWVCFMNKDNKT